MDLIGFVLQGFLYLCLYCISIIFLAFIILWLLDLLFGIQPSVEVMWWGKRFVLVLCFIAAVAWILSIMGVGGGPFYFPPRSQQSTPGYQR